VASIDFLAPEIEGFNCKNVNIDRRTQRRCSASTGNGDMDAGWDDVVLGRPRTLWMVGRVATGLSV
jgi:hypothetical protein